MRRLLLVMLAVGALAACQNTLEPQTDDGGDGGSDGPAMPQESRLDIRIYTVDSVTPTGDVTLVVTNGDTGSETTKTMTRDTSSVAGTTLWTSWISVADLPSQGYLLGFTNASGAEALGVQGCVDPWWREIRGTTNGPFEEVDSSLTILEYTETIRHWVGSPAGRTVSLTGSVVDEDGGELGDFTGTVRPAHSVSSRATYIEGGDAPVASASSSFSFSATNVRTIDAEADLPRPDSVYLDVAKPFYASVWKPVPHSVMHGQSTVALEPIGLYANRELTLDWMHSASGQFQSTDGSSAGVMASVPTHDFVDRDLAEYYRTTTLADPNLIYLNGYSFESSNSVRVRAWLSSYDGGLSLYPDGAATGLALVSGVSTLPADFDATQISSWGSYLEVDQGGNPVIAVKSDDGYALVHLADIHRMTPTEMQTIIDEYNAQ
ncbi:MAG: hypothetical protein ACOCW3_05575 [Spirochaetota bacterium]